MSQPTEMQVKVYEIIRDNPGISAYRVRRLVYGRGCGIATTLIAMEASGLYLSEDGNGLYVYEEAEE